MASNTLASIATATAAGYVLERFTRGSLNITRLSKPIAGQPGASGGVVFQEGEGSTSGNADTAALANLNAWRLNRYGSDSTAASNSGIPNASPLVNGGMVVDKQPVHSALTKDKN
jgi:hypothetical protein